MNNKVIFTCITGGYDNLEQPQVIYSGFDYICFTDQPIKQNGIWEIRPIPFKHNDNAITSRYVKLNPHIAVPEYEYSIYIDSNVHIKDDYLMKRIMLMIKKGSKMALIPHPIRDCIYDDAIVCGIYSKEKFRNIYNVVKKYKAEGFPRNYGLSENNIIFRRHNDNDVIKVSEEWWCMMVNYIKRDQLSLYYILWKLDMSVDMLFPNGVSTNTKEHFNRVNHNLKINNLISRGITKCKNYLLYKIFLSRYIRTIK